MGSHALSPHEAANWVIFIFSACLSALGVFILVAKSLFHGLTTEKEEAPLRAGDPCPHCVDGVLQHEQIEADPEKIQIEKQILRCNFCHAAMTTEDNEYDM